MLDRNDFGPADADALPVSFTAPVAAAGSEFPPATATMRLSESAGRAIPAAISVPTTTVLHFSTDTSTAAVSTDLSTGSSTAASRSAVSISAATSTTAAIQQPECPDAGCSALADIHSSAASSATGAVGINTAANARSANDEPHSGTFTSGWSGSFDSRRASLPGHSISVSDDVSGCPEVCKNQKAPCRSH